MNKLVRIYLLLSLLVLSSVVLAQEGDADKLSLSDIVGKIDLSIPQSPAFTALGVSPENVVQADDFRTFAAGITNSLDPRGNLQQGLALDARPYMIIYGKKSTLNDYQTSRTVRILSSAQLSFATASGQSDSDKADRQGLGLNLKLWRQSDPALKETEIKYLGLDNKEKKGSVLNCYKEYLEAASQSGIPDVGVFPITPEERVKLEGQIADKSRLAVSKCLEPYKEQHWNAGSLELSIAGTRVEVDDMDENGSMAAIAFSYGIRDYGQIIVRGAYQDDLLLPVEDQAEKFMAIDEQRLGARLRLGSRKGTFSIEGEWVKSDTSNGIDDKYYRASLGAEFEVMKDIWLQLGVGKTNSSDLFKDDVAYSGQLRFGFTEGSLLGGG